VDAHPKPLLQIGGAADGPSGFAFIKGVVRLSDGSIAVANQRPSEIRIFDASGRFVRSLGRNGTGPGEFNRVLFRLLRSGDTLIEATTACAIRSSLRMAN